jgi:hypothetical protein
MVYYVYILRDPRKENEPFYVGKGKDSRAEFHGNKADIHNPFKTNVINKIKEVGLEPVIEYYKEHIEESIAFAEEIALIKQYGRRDNGTGILTNLTDGGEGSSGYIRTAGATEKWYATRKNSGYRHSEEVKGRIAKSNTGQKRSEETKKRLSESHIGKIQSEESNLKRSAKLKGRTISEEQKKSLSENRLGSNNPMFGKDSPMKGKTHSEETKNKIKEARQKQVISEETKLKMSESAKRRHKVRKENNGSE